MHANARCCTASVRLIIRRSEDHSQGHGRLARFFPCGAWEGLWEESPGQPSKYTLTWGFATGSGPLTTTARPPGPGRGLWWEGRGLAADRRTAMDLARGSPRLDAAAARDIARAGRLWEESCRRAGADAAEPSRPVIEALCAELVTAGAATLWVPETRPWSLTCRDAGRC